MVRAIAKAISSFPTWGLLFAALGWVPGVAIWQVARHGEATFSLTSKGVGILLDQPARIAALSSGLVSLVVLAIVYAGLFLLKRRKDPETRYDSYFQSLNQRFLVLLTLPFLAAVYTTKLEGKHDFLNLTFIAGAVTVFGAWVYLFFDGRGSSSLPSSTTHTTGTIGAKVAWLVVAALYFAYGYVMSRFSIIDHRNLNTAIFDLGIYDNIVWSTANGDFLGCTFCRGGKHYSAHFDPILWILTPIYRLSPRAETLLVFQSFWLALGGIPLFLYAKRVLGHSWWALPIVAAYYMMPALHGANLYDFHSLSLLVPTAMFAVYFLDGQRFVGYWLSIVVLLLTREDMSLLSCFIGLYAWFTGQRKAGIATIIVALSYLVVVKTTIMAPGLIMDDSNVARSFAWYYTEMLPFREEGALGIVTTLLTDPVASLAVLFNERKVIYFALLLWPLLLLPLISGRKRILMLYGLAFIGLATRKYVYSIHFQYSCLLLPFLALSVADAIVRMRDAKWVAGFGLSAPALQKALLVTLLLSGGLMGAEYGALAPNAAFRAGWSKIAWSQRDTQREQYQELLDLKTMVPAEASVSTDSRVGPHVTDRPVVNRWPFVGNADYILLMKASSRGKHAAKYRRIIQDKMYAVEYESRRFVLLRRLDTSPDPEETEDGEEKLHPAHQEPQD